MTNYEVTIGYKAVITVHIKAENEEDAKQKSIEIFQIGRGRLCKSPKINVQIDNATAFGCLNMDETWGMVD